MQKMVIFQRFSRTIRENFALPKALNGFTIGGGDLMAYPQAKSDNGMSIVIATENKRKVISPCNYFSFNQLHPSVTRGTMKPHSIIEPVYNTIRNVAAQEGSYLANHCFHPVRYNHFGLFTPLRAEQAAAPFPGYARGFSHRAKAPSTMPDRNRNIRDHKRRLLAAKYELRRKLYKALCRDPELPSAMRAKHRAKLSKLPRNSSFARVTNRCIFSGRAHAVYKKFRISRIQFRTLANQGLLMGVKKASW